MLPVTPPAPEVSVLIPAFNEVAHIASTIRGALAVLAAQGLSFEIVAIDDGSTDGTAAAIADATRTDTRISLLRHDRNRGLGASYASGVAASRGRYVSWLPGDDAIPPEFLATMIAARHQADVVIAYPVFDRPRPMLRAWLSVSYVQIMNRLCGGRVRYFNCITLIRRDLLLEVLPRNNTGFGVFAEILVRLLRARRSYVEVPIASRIRPMERSKAFRWRNVVSVCGRTVGLWWSLRGRPAPPGS